MTSAHDILGFEYDWLGTDVEGHVALFSTAGGGYAPDPFLLDTYAHHEAIQAILALPVSTAARFAPELAATCSNTWREVAERGLFAYDADVHGGPYRLVAAPLVAVHLAALPDIAAVAGAVTVSAATFPDLSIISTDLLRGSAQELASASSPKAQPTGLRPGLIRVTTLDVQATQRDAAHAGFAIFALPGDDIADRESFFEAVRATLPLSPLVVGSRSWDALSDSLWQGLLDHAARRVAILWPNARAMWQASPGDFQIAIAVLSDVATLLQDSVATVGNPKDLTVIVEGAAEQLSTGSLGNR